MTQATAYLDRIRAKQGLTAPPPKKKQSKPKPKASEPKPKPEAKPPAPIVPKFRLPDGARFEATYKKDHDDFGKWNVTLTVDGKAWTKEGSALHNTIMKLGQEFNKKGNEQ